MNSIVRHGFAPTSLAEAVEFSQMLAKSSMVPKAYQGRAEDILVACIWGSEVGLAPLQALQNIAVINGRPSVYGDAAMAMVQASSVCEDIQETIDGDTAICTAKRKGRAPVVAKFSIDDAKRAGLWGKQGPWTQYPKRMLQMRARGFALRDAFPDVLKGLITQEEARDFPVEADAQVISPTVSETAPAIEAPADMAEPEGRYKLFLPDGSVYSAHETRDEWIDAIGAMCQKIRSSTKYSVEEKVAKIRALRAANKSQQVGMDAEALARLASLTHRSGEDE